MSTALSQRLRSLVAGWALLLAHGALAQPAMLGGVVDQIVAGGAHTCLLNAEDTLRCWGSNQFGQLGDNTLTPRTTPSGVSFNLGPQLLAATAGARHTCAMTAGVDAGKAYCFGDKLDKL